MNGTFLAACFGVSLLLIFPFVFFLAVFNIPLIYATILCAAVFLFLTQIPLLQARQTARLIEAELPLAALSTHCDLLLGLNPYKCLDSVFLKKEFARAKLLASKGVPFALLPVFFYSPSKKFREYLNLLCGGSSIELKKFYHDLFEEQRNELKIFAAKTSVVSMFFLVVAAVVPALFSAIVLIGPGLGFGFSSLQIVLVYVAVFPLLNYAFLFYLELITPPQW